MDSETLERALRRLSGSGLFGYYVIAKDQMHLVRFDQPIVYIVQNTDVVRGKGEPEKGPKCLFLYFLWPFTFVCIFKVCIGHYGRSGEEGSFSFVRLELFLMFILTPFPKRQKGPVKRLSISR